MVDSHRITSLEPFHPRKGNERDLVCVFLRPRLDGRAGFPNFDPVAIVTLSHVNSQASNHFIDRFHHPHMPRVFVIAPMPIEPFLEDRHVEGDRKRPYIISLASLSDEQGGNYRRHVSLADRI